MAYDESNGHVTTVHCPAPVWMVVWSDGTDEWTIILRYVLSGLLCMVQLDDMQSWAVVTRLLTYEDKNFLAVYLQILNWLQSQSLFIRRWLQTLVTVLVLSRLDYGNATLIGIPASLYRHLQPVLNATARSVAGLSRSDHINEMLASLHLSWRHWSSDRCMDWLRSIWSTTLSV